METDMTFEELTARIKAGLSAAGIDAAAFEAGEIVKFYGGKRFCPVGDGTVSAALVAQKRRISGEPLQYILGEWEFYGLPFKVGPGVLIPRADTETAVDCAAALLKGKAEPKVLDICAGSGCIGIALAKTVGAKVTFVEKSPDAIKYLKENLVLNHTPGEIITADVLNGAFETEKRFDLLISNPPYIRTAELPQLSKEVKCEPKMALDGGEDGLLFYRKIAGEWKHLLKSGGHIVFETGYDQRREVEALLGCCGFTDVSAKKDICGNDRVVFAKYIY